VAFQAQRRPTQRHPYSGRDGNRADRGDRHRHSRSLKQGEPVRANPEERALRERHLSAEAKDEIKTEYQKDVDQGNVANLQVINR
jgi:hypothetical protein